MSFIWSTLRVNNLGESVKFYTEVIGLKILDRMETGSGDNIVFLGDDKRDTKIELICGSSDISHKTSVGEDIFWGFKVKSLDDTMTMLNEMGIDYAGPIQPNPDIKFIFLKDPNGMNIQLIEN